MTLAEKVHEGNSALTQIDDLIADAFQEYEPKVFESLEYTLSSDWYDNSLEIHITSSHPYPYEPCKEVREVVYNLGFDRVYWNFESDFILTTCSRVYPKTDREYKSCDEIRDWEPRHGKYHEWLPTKYGYVDNRFVEEEWVKIYKFK